MDHSGKEKTYQLFSQRRFSKEFGLIWYWRPEKANIEQKD